MRSWFVIALLPLSIIGCGEDKNVCEKAFEIRTSDSRQFCEYVIGNDTCWQCACQCLMKGRQWEVLYYWQVADIILPSCEGTCLKKPACEGTLREESKICLADEVACAESQLALPGIIELMERGLYPCEENHIGYEDCTPGPYFSCD